MRRTLERLKKDAFSRLKEFLNRSEKLTNDFNPAGDLIVINAMQTFNAFIRYIRSLEDYTGELDEEWDKLLKSVEQAVQEKPTERKEDKKKTSYIK